MEKIIIPKTKASPEVEFDHEKNILTIEGQSYPENAFKFYEPLFEWVDEYLQVCKEEIVININLSYINTSSSKCVMMLLERFEDACRGGCRLKLNWYYDLENESELECAEEFKEDTTFPFEILPLNESR